MPTETETTQTETATETEAQKPDPKDAAAAVDTNKDAPSAGTAPTVDANAAPATGSPAKEPKKPAVDIDALIEAAAKAQSDAEERIRQAETLRNKLSKWEKVEEDFTKADTKEAKLAATKALVRNMLADGYEPSEIIQVFAEDVELPPEQIDPADLPKELPKLIQREVNKVEKARLEREAAERKAAEEKAAAEAKAEADRKAAEDAQTREEYVAECAKDLKANADKFPLCTAWAHRITTDKILAVAAGFAKVNNRAPTGEELFPAIEAEFRAELEKATGRVAVPAAAKPGQPATNRAAVDDEIERELEEMDRKRAQVIKKDPTIPTGPKVEHASSGRTVEDDILDQLDRMDKSRNGLLQYD